MAKIEAFGKKILLEVYNSNGRVILSTSELRVDFDIRMLQGWNRAKFSIFNLDKKTIKSMSYGDTFVRLYVGLHDRPMELLIDDMYASNVMTEKKVPNSVTTLYCVDKLRKNMTSKQIDTVVRKPNLNKILNAIAKGSSEPMKFTLINFPEEVLKHKPANPFCNLSGEVEECLKDLGGQYGFVHHIKGNNIIVKYNPVDSSKAQSAQSSRGVLVLDSLNMRANPEIGVARLSIKSNLDPQITTTTMLDTSKLVTASLETSFNTLTVDTGHIHDLVSGWSLYDTLSVNHIGGNFTKNWTTKAIAIKAHKGSVTPEYNWFG